MSDYLSILEQVIATHRDGDHEGFLALLTDDVEYHYHVTTRPLIGKDWVRKFLARYDEICADVTWRIDRHAEGDGFLMVEGYESYTDLRTGERVEHPYMGILEFTGDRISAWRDYFEMSPAVQGE